MQKKIIQRNVKDKKSEAVKDQLTKKKADQSRFTGKKSVVQELVKDEPVKKGPETGSGYLIAGDGRIEDLKKEVLYQLLGPVFFGDTVFHSEKELIHFFKELLIVMVSSFHFPESFTPLKVSCNVWCVR